MRTQPYPLPPPPRELPPAARAAVAAHAAALASRRATAELQALRSQRFMHPAERLSNSRRTRQARVLRWPLLDDARRAVKLVRADPKPLRSLCAVLIVYAIAVAAVPCNAWSYFMRSARLKKHRTKCLSLPSQSIVARLSGEPTSIESKRRVKRHVYLPRYAGLGPSLLAVVPTAIVCAGGASAMEIHGGAGSIAVRAAFCLRALRSQSSTVRHMLMISHGARAVEGTCQATSSRAGRCATKAACARCRFVTLLGREYSMRGKAWQTVDVFASGGKIKL
jgi:hypothetical protein